MQRILCFAFLAFLALVVVGFVANCGVVKNNTTKTYVTDDDAGPPSTAACCVGFYCENVTQSVCDGFGGFWSFGETCTAFTCVGDDDTSPIPDDDTSPSSDDDDASPDDDDTSPASDDDDASPDDDDNDDSTCDTAAETNCDTGVNTTYQFCAYWCTGKQADDDDDDDMTGCSATVCEDGCAVAWDNALAACARSYCPSHEPEWDCWGACEQTKLTCDRADDCATSCDVAFEQCRNGCPTNPPTECDALLGNFGGISESRWPQYSTPRVFRFWPSADRGAVCFATGRGDALITAGGD